MFGRIFKRKNDRQDLHVHHTFSHLHETLKNSFGNIKKDMNQLNSWISHFKERHIEHDKRFDYLFAKIEEMESKLDNMNSSETYETPIQESYEEPEVIEEPIQKESMWDLLTPTQQKICWKLSSLHKEMPDQWIPMKYLAQEMYPEKEYSKVRSAMSQFISNLEEAGFIKRKRRGKQAYVKLIKTDIHPRKSQLLAKIFNQ